MRGVAASIVGVLPAVDAFVVAGLFVYSLQRSGAGIETPASLLLLMLAVPVTSSFLRRYGVYDSHRVERPREVARRVVFAHVCAAAVIVSASLLMAHEHWREILTVFVASCALLGATKVAVYIVLRSLRRRGLDQRSVLLVGDWADAERLARRFAESPEWGLRIDSVVPQDAAGKETAQEFRTFPDGKLVGSSIEIVVRSRVIDEVVIPVHIESSPNVFEEARRFAPYGMQVRVVFGEGHQAAPRMETYAGGASLDILPTRLDNRAIVLKRTVDLVLGLVLLIGALPVIAVVALAIQLTSPGAVFFTQTRVGLNGRQFRMIKFRTMYDGAEFQVRHLHRSIPRGPVFKDPSDYRITPIGRILRRFSLDELPQLINVLKGDMSLVGPRPLPVSEADQVRGEYRRRFSVLPGLTCIWQVSGRSDVDYDRWMQYDLQYVDRWSLWSDAVLILRTIPAVLSGRGAY